MSTFSIVVPVYKNEGSIERLLDAVGGLQDGLSELNLDLELVVVIDGSPDRCYEIVQERLPTLDYRCELVAHSRNFGSFAAIRTGLAHASGDYFGVLAADLQEPPELMIDFARNLLADDCDVVVGRRVDRNDSATTVGSSRLFWWLYRRFILPEMPPGGVDIFGCTGEFRERLLDLEESRTSLVGLIFWLGFQRKEVEYTRLVRQEGRSAWTLRKKLSYVGDSVFSFTDYPIRLLLALGFFGTILSVFIGLVVIATRITGNIEVPGYAALMLVTLVFGSLMVFGVGLVGEYSWRTYENTKQRPSAVVARVETNGVPSVKRRGLIAVDSISTTDEDQQVDDDDIDEDERAAA